jgi:predicted small secreted protein
MKQIKTYVALFACCVVGLLSACNTVEGAGQDLQQGGHAISKAANNSK